MQIREDDLRGPRIAALLQGHIDEMHELTPPESVHALDLAALRAPELTFWSAWEGDELVGCGALKELDAATAEIKSMRTAPEHRRRGVGALILAHLLEVATERGYERLLLETGSLPAFSAARKLYARQGFEERGPYGDYSEDPNLVFMELRLVPRS